MKKILLALGNELRGDDSAGMLIGQLVKEKCPSWIVYLAGTTPESYVLKISEERPDILVIVDATMMNKRPGEFYLIPLERVAEELMLSTHRIPTRIILELLQKSCKKIHFIGVQPKNLDFGPPSKEVIEACKKIANIICEDKLDEIPWL